MPLLKFVHSADLHLDSPFRGIARDAPDYVADTLRRATFDAYDNIIALCLKEQADALLVAGDIYDGADRSLRAQLRFVDGLNRLDASNIRSFICHGNHDPLDGWEARLDMPPACVQFGPEVATFPVFPDAPDRAAVYGISYPTREMRENLSLRFHNPPLLPDASPRFSIALLHANVGGNTDHDSYSPCTVADLSASPINYWALGHIHTRQTLRNAQPAVVYPGNPQGRHPNEPGPRGVELVEVDDYGNLKRQFHPVDVVRWQTLSLDISGIDDEQTLLNAINRQAESALETADGRPVVARLSLAGRNPLHRSLRRPDFTADVMEQLNARYADTRPWLWCERITPSTTSPVDRRQAAQREDFAGDLARIASELRENPNDALPQLRRDLRALYSNSNAASYLREYQPSDDELLTLLSAAEDECLAALISDEDDAE